MEFGDFFEEFFGLIGGVYFGEVVDEFSISEEEGLSAWFVVGVDDFKGVTDFTIGIGEEGEGEAEFIREGFLVCHGVHGNPDDLNFLFGECGRCSLQRFDLLGSPGCIGHRVEEDGGPGAAEGVFEIDHLSGLSGGGELGSLPA